jgi:hypothetical protein
VRLPCVITCTLAALGWLHACSEAVRADEAHDLARIAYGEVGGPGPDTAAIHAVLEDRARVLGVTWRRAARMYAGGHLGTRTRPGARRWVAQLHPSGRRPPAWPSRASWPRTRPRWLATLRQSREVVAGRETAPCSPHHWGSLDPRLPDVHRARRAGWLPVDCGETVLGYWHVPRRLEAT